jgi:hypothetical protein
MTKPVNRVGSCVVCTVCWRGGLRGGCRPVCVRGAVDGSCIRLSEMRLA